MEKISDSYVSNLIVINSINAINEKLGVQVAIKI